MLFILKHEANNRLRFGALSSPEGRAAQKTISPDTPIDSIVFQKTDGTFYHSSDALLEIAKFMKMPLSWAQILRIIPRPWRNSLYGWIARNRHRFGPKKRACPVPTEAMRKRMI